MSWEFVVSTRPNGVLKLVPPVVMSSPIRERLVIIFPTLNEDFKRTGEIACNWAVFSGVALSTSFTLIPLLRSRV